MIYNTFMQFFRGYIARIGFENLVGVNTNILKGKNFTHTNETEIKIK